MAGPPQPRRRFAPVPIETTFSSSSNKKVNGQNTNRSRSRNQSRGRRRIGPNPEPTPEPSPRSPSPPPKEMLRPRRRFAPQLIETSRRSRRVGDKGPATRPTDKTDFTPYTKNIYTVTRHHRGRRRWDEYHTGNMSGHMPPTRRESEDEGVKEYLLELAAKEAERQMQETAMLAFPNSHVREGNVDHFYFRDSSDSDNSSESHSPKEGHPNHVRRQSSNLGLNWWHKHMQEHAQHLEGDKDHDQMDVDEPEKRDKEQEDTEMLHATDADLDKMDLTVPPDPMWTTSNNKADRGDSPSDAHRPIGQSLMPLMPHMALMPLIQTDAYVTAPTKAAEPAQAAPAPSRPVGESIGESIGESPKPFVPSTAPTSRPAEVAFAKPSQIPPETGFRKQGGPFGRPFGGLGYKPPAPRFQRQKFVSPPMLGKELKFRRCPSPKQTKLEPDHLFARRNAEEKNRDLSGAKGLWRGYCYKSESNDGYLVPAELQAPPLMATPMPPASPGDTDSSTVGSASLSDEPSSISSYTDSSCLSPSSASTAEHRGRSSQAKGIQMLHGINERLQLEKAQTDLEEKIAQEFDDAFVTQVYNYLSLGYPATARAFDEELSKISRMSVEELERDDEKSVAKGHMMEADNDTPLEKRSPRWKALRTYITEWARQHPDLDNLQPSAWGVRERRGSWAI